MKLVTVQLPPFSCYFIPESQSYFDVTEFDINFFLSSTCINIKYKCVCSDRPHLRFLHCPFIIIYSSILCT
jgi:hypothetical protein